MKLIPRVLSLAALAAAGCAATVHAQTIQPCSTDEVRQRLIEENPDLLRQDAEYEAGLQEYLQMRAGLREGDDTTVYIIPVVFHVLYDPTAPSDNHNVSNAQIQAQMVKLNMDYRKQNADTANIVDPFKAINADAHVEFRLATKDPFGNCTNGINRITSLRSSQAGDFSKLSPWFRDRYVNIWVINSLYQSQPGQNTLAYSQLPAYVQDDLGALRDGVIMIASEVNGSSTTLTHELGHFLNLQHVWGSTNSPGVACGDDGVEDTPITKGSFSCNVNNHECNSWPIHEAYAFGGVNTGSGTTDPTLPPTGQYQDSLPGLAYSPFTAHGVSPNPAENGRFSFSQWDTGAVDGESDYANLTGSINTSKYYEFTVTPGFGQTLSLSGMTFRASRSASGPRTFAVRTSINNFSSNGSVSITGTDTMISVQAPNVFYFKNDSANEWRGNKLSLAITDSRNAVTFRIYAWNAEDGAGYFGVDSVQLSGDFGHVENAQNYMDYAGCSTEMFTHGQSDRMRATLNSNVSSRNKLWSDDTHQYTGTAGYEVTCAPEANFYTMTSFVCPGVQVQFKDNSTRATPTSWAWTFEGGTPATSSQQNPTVSFSEPGTHNVTLTVSNDVGSSTVSKWNAVYIGANYSEVATPLAEAFNTPNDMNRWPTQNFEGNNSYWQWTNEAGHNNAGAAKLNASNTYTLPQDLFSTETAYLADIDNLITPSLAMPFAQNLTVSFWYAYSTKTSTASAVTERLRVYASSNCGASWLLRKTVDGGSLVTAGVRSPGYVPLADEWREATFTLPSIYAGDRVRLKFEFTSGLSSNDLYIDDVNIGSSNVGIEELAGASALGLMPNPATNHLTVLMDLNGASSGTLSFMDMTGRTIHSETVQAGEMQKEYDLKQLGLGSGMYLVQLKHGRGQRTERLVVQ